jgi:hypothetical protein
MAGWLAAPTGTLWPTEAQALILAAAVGPEGSAIDAFRAWRRRVDIAAPFAHETVRLLPLLYDRMRRLGLDDPLMGRLKGVYRLAWYRTHGLLHRTAPVVAALHAGGIDTLMLKGVPLVLTYYRNPALRPMADIDVLVPPAQVRRAMALIEAAGWQGAKTASDDELRYRHALQYRNAQGDEIDLHWHALPDLCSAAADREYWAGARPLDFAGTPTLQLDPALLLLHLVVHGVRYNREPPVRWIADSVTVLRAEAAGLDWARLLDHARTQLLTSRLGLGLAHLARHYAQPIPAEVLRALAAARPSLIERIENTVVLADYERTYGPVLAKPWVIFAEYCRRHQAGGSLGFPLGLARYLRYRWRTRAGQPG